MKKLLVLLLMTAWITRYNHAGVMASGKQTYVGAVAVSDRSIPLGTKIKVGSKLYTVEDRTAKLVHARQGLTIDIYDPRPTKDLLQWGKRRMTVEIIK